MGSRSGGDEEELLDRITQAPGGFPARAPEAIVDDAERVQQRVILVGVGEAPLALGGVERLGARVAEENLGRVGASGRHGGRVKDPPLQGGRLASGELNVSLGGSVEKRQPRGAIANCGGPRARVRMIINSMNCIDNAIAAP